METQIFSKPRNFPHKDKKRRFPSADLKPDAFLAASLRRAEPKAALGRQRVGDSAASSGDEEKVTTSPEAMKKTFDLRH